MTPAFILTLSGLLAAPATPENPTPTLQVTPELRISAEFLEAGTRVPRPGYFLDRQNMRLLLTEAATAGAACDARVRAQQTLCTEQLAASAANCAAQLAPLTERISELQAREDDLVEAVQETERALARWRLWTYVGGGAAAATITFLAIR
jgi:hypothetical protein